VDAGFRLGEPKERPIAQEFDEAATASSGDGFGLALELRRRSNGRLVTSLLRKLGEPREVDEHDGWRGRHLRHRRQVPRRHEQFDPLHDVGRELLFHVPLAEPCEQLRSQADEGSDAEHDLWREAADFALYEPLLRGASDLLGEEFDPSNHGEPRAFAERARSSENGVVVVRKTPSLEETLHHRLLLDVDG
jgi:hypothetical protein